MGVLLRFIVVLAVLLGAVGWFLLGTRMGQDLLLARVTTAAASA